MAEDNEFYLTEPTSTLDLRRRLEAENGTQDAAVVGGRDFATEDTDTSAYIGVSPEYMTHANDTEMPLTADEGPELEALEKLTSGFAVQKAPEAGEVKQTVGTGSSAESIYTATSGEDFSSEEVDAQAVQQQAQEANDAAVEESGNPATADASASAQTTEGSTSSSVSL